MLPNHAPYIIAGSSERWRGFFPAHRPRLGAPQHRSAYAARLRRPPEAADTFPQDVLELQRSWLRPLRVSASRRCQRGNGRTALDLGSSHSARCSRRMGLLIVRIAFRARSSDLALEIYRSRSSVRATRPALRNGRLNIVARHRRQSARSPPPSRFIPTSSVARAV